MSTLTTTDFNVDFNEATKYLEYSSQALAVNDLKASTLIEDQDYIVVPGSGAIFPEVIFLSQNGFKKFILESSTEKARAIQKTFVGVDDVIPMLPSSDEETDDKTFSTPTIRWVTNEYLEDHRRIFGRINDLWLEVNYSGRSTVYRDNFDRIDDYEICELVSEPEGIYPRLRYHIKDDAFRFLRLNAADKSKLAHRIATERKVFEPMSLDEALSIPLIAK